MCGPEPDQVGRQGITLVVGHDFWKASLEPEGCHFISFDRHFSRYTTDVRHFMERWRGFSESAKDFNQVDMYRTEFAVEIIDSLPGFVRPFCK